MKKNTLPESSRTRTQRETVRRAQQSGRRQSDTASRRLAGQPSKRNYRASPVRDDVSVEVPHTLRRAFVMMLTFASIGLIIYVLVSNPSSLQRIQMAVAQTTATAQSDTVADISMRIGLVSGHHGNDSGSVCQDGLTEAQVNLDIATRVAQLLRAQGYTVDVLDEFDSRLKGYQARLLLSIHADSCTYINDLATGYKVARVLDSKTPEEDDRLVSCITVRYKAATGLRFHANTVTYDMTKYHAFYEVNPQTPAAIIETGFLYLDRPILTHRPELVAQGIYSGIQCFLDGLEQ